jgi:energy-coupling factor transport system ATP-binding protein
LAPVVEAQDLGYVYMPGTPLEQRALQGVSFAIEAGECVGLIGPTGCGKSTLISHLNGLLRPTEGRLTVLGRDVGNTRDLRSLRFEVGLVFQSPEAQLFEETVFAEIAYGPRNMRLPAADIEGRVVRAAALLGLDLDALRQRSPLTLSGGEQRRVAMASILSMEPTVLIFDEPTAGLDPEGRALCLAAIQDLIRNGRTLVVVSHDLELIAALASRVLVLEGGRLAWNGDLRAALRAGLPGLRPTPAGRLCQALSAAGWAVPGDVVTVPEASEAIIAALREQPVTDL